MKRVIFVLLFLILSTFITTHAEDVSIILFYSDSCPHCHEELTFLDKVKAQYPQINIETHEVSKSKENAELFKNTMRDLGQKTKGVPTTVINDQVIIGYQSESTTGKEILNTIESILNPTTKVNKKSSINIPIINRQLDISNMSLPLLSIVIGTLDGFNPCAMWVLLFLISMLLGMEDRKKMWILGSTFIITSSVIYFLFLTAWLNTFLILGYSTLLRVIIGFGAAGIGLHYLNEYRKHETGCEVSNTENRQKTFNRIKNIIKENNLFLALGGIILLAIAVNLVELLCSAGLPAIYTQVLVLNKLPTWQYYAYMLLYILFFMIDDLFVFIVAMITLQTKGISSKYTHISRLIGGVIMLVIGILMLFKPEILTMGF